jgi:hypothetical protein
MATLREIARVTKGRHDLPDISGGELKNNAWLLYEAVLEEAKRAGTQTSDDGVPGYRWRGHVKTVMRSLWRGILPGMETENDARSNRVQEALYRYLRTTGNLRLIERGLKEPSLWWVRADWNDAPPSHAETSRQRQVARQAARVTSQEAGEDREPLPVDLKYKCPHCGRQFSSKVRRSAHMFTFEKHESLEEWVVMGLKAIEDVPSGPTDVFRVIEPMGFLGSLALVTDTLREMSQNRKSPVVHAQVPGRDRVTYALRSRLHEMKPVSYYAPTCREPGCGAGPFKNTDSRITHESEVHVDSPNRRFACTLCEWKGYDAVGISMHLLRAHKIPNEERVEIMEQATAAADKLPLRVLVEPWGDRPVQGLLKDVPGQITASDLVETSQRATPRPQAVDVVVDSGQEGQPKTLRSSLSGDPMEMLIRAATVISVEIQQMRKDNQDLRGENEDLRATIKRLRKLERLQELLKGLDDDE